MNEDLYYDECSSASSSSNEANYGYPPPQRLLKAVQNADLEQVKDFFQEIMSIVNKTVDEKGRTALHLATEKQQKHIVKELLNRGACPNVKDNDGDTPLHYAAKQRDLDLVKELLNHGADPNAKNSNCDMMPLHLVCFRFDEIEDEDDPCIAPLVQELLKHGADPNAKDKQGDTPLLLVCHPENDLIHDMEIVVRELLKCGANPNVTDDEYGRTTLHHVVAVEQLDLSGAVEELLKHGANPNIQDVDGNTPLHGANCIATVDHLLQHPGIFVDKRNKQGDTPLATSLYYIYRPEVSLKLIQFGASVKELDNNASTALHRLADRCYHRCGADEKDRCTRLHHHVLKHNDIDINQQDKLGQTALHIACRSRCRELVKLLLEMGAKTDILCSDGETPLHKLCYQKKDIFLDEDLIDALDWLPATNRDILNRTNQQGLTALQVAISQRYFLGAMKLMSRNDDIDIHNKTTELKATPLHLACALCSDSTLGQLDTIKKLVAKKADLSAVDACGNTPLHIALGHDENIYGAYVNRPSRLISSCTVDERWEVTKHLLDQSGDHRHALNWKGLTPLMAAAEADAPLTLLFQILTYTGGTILNCPWSMSQSTSSTKRCNTSNSAENPKKRNKTAG